MNLQIRTGEDATVLVDLLHAGYFNLSSVHCLCNNSGY